MGYTTRFGSRLPAEQHVTTPHSDSTVCSDADSPPNVVTPSRSQERIVHKPRASAAVKKRRQNRQLIGQRHSDRTSHTTEDAATNETSNSETLAQSNLRISSKHQSGKIRNRISHFMQLEMSRLERKVDFDEHYAKFRQKLAPDVASVRIL